MVKEIYISVDIEADGVRPGDYSMTSLGAVVAGYRTTEGEVVKFDATAEENRFYAELKPISDKWWPEAMRIGIFKGFGKEAAKDDPYGSKRREYIEKNGEDPTVVMTNFAQFVLDAEKKHDGTAIFAGYPLGFDWLFTYWYLSKFSELGSPFGFSRHMDIKTLYAAKADKLVSRSIKARIPRSLHSKLPHTHIAVDDAAEQGELLMNILAWDRKNK